MATTARRPMRTSVTHSAFQRGLFVCCLLALTWCSGSFADTAQKAVGMISGMSGVVKIKATENATWQPALLLATITPGAQINVGEKASAVIVFFADGHRETLNAGALARIEAKTCKVEKGTRTLAPTAAKSANGKLLKDARMEVETFPGGVLMRPYTRGLVLLSPIGNDMLIDRPLFCWNTIPNATEYTIAIKDDHSKQLWQRTTMATSLPYPAGETPLQPGQQYFWTVRAMKTDVIASEATASCNLAPAEKAADVRKAAQGLATEDQPQDLTPYLMLASLYQTAKCYADAIQVYQQLAIWHPQETMIHQTLFGLYRMTEQMECAAYEESTIKCIPVKSTGSRVNAVP